ncbi:MAG: membrane dipeptidase [Clostridia bacterium]
MRFFDLHCDTLGKCLRHKRGFSDNGFHVDLNKAKYIDTYIQCTAAFIPDRLGANESKQYCENMLALLENENVIKNLQDLKKAEKAQFFLPTIENCSALAGDISNIEMLKKNFVKIATLTWNGDNELGSGVGGTDLGLSDFGKDVLEKFCENKIVPDISHASEKLFWEVCDYTEQKIVATHSCAKKICSHKRNLSDEQIKEIIKRKGLVGINFYKNFLNNNPENACIDDIVEHCEYMLAMGAEDVLAIGSDFDGCDLPRDVLGIESVGEIYERFLKLKYNETLLDKIFFKNAYDFITVLY